MNDFQEYIEQVKIKNNIKSNLQLAKKAGVSYCSVHRVMKQDAFAFWSFTKKIAEFNGDDPREIYSLMHSTKRASQKNSGRSVTQVNLVKNQKETIKII